MHYISLYTLSYRNDGDTAPVLVAYIWYTRVKQLVLTAGIQEEVPILSVYQQAQNI